MELVSRLSLANHSDSGSFLCLARIVASKNNSGRWKDMWCLLFDLSRTLLIGGGLLVPYSFPGPSVIT